MIDDEDYNILSQVVWCAVRSRNVMYAERGVYSKDRITKVKMHRVITGANPGEIVDHIDGDGLNNCKSNLRIVTPRQNCQNKHIGKSSIYPGVSFDGKRGKWSAYYRKDGRHIFAGYHPNEDDAFSAYKVAVETHTNEKVLT